MLVKDILIERDIAFEEASSFSFILSNDIKSHPQTDRDNEKKGNTVRDREGRL